MENTLKSVLEECLWDDYKIDIKEAEELIQKGDIKFISFIVRRIIYNSSFPSSRLKALFSPEILKEILDKTDDKSPRIIKRIKLIRSILFNESEGGDRRWITD